MKTGQVGTLVGARLPKRLGPLGPPKVAATLQKLQVMFESGSVDGRAIVGRCGTARDSAE
jgi:hypothetical protein